MGLRGVSISTKSVFIIAELSANHNNDYDLAVKTIEAMAESGADAVKVQTYTADSLSIDADNEYFRAKTEGLWMGYRSYDLYKEASMPYEWQPKLQKIAHDIGLEFFSSPFDKEGVDFLETLNVPMYKIASLEITDIPLIKYAASKGKPMIISTGVAELEDIELAVETCRKVGNQDITLLKCTSNYPASLNDANLLSITDMKKKFKVNVGVSDHTMGSLVPIVAVSLGAQVIEKHFILNRDLGGPDAAFSMEPKEFKSMVDDVYDALDALGRVSYSVPVKDKLRRRSLFITEDVNAGDEVSVDNLRSVRPGHGADPKLFNDLLGKTYNSNFKKGTPFKPDMVIKK